MKLVIIGAGQQAAAICKVIARQQDVENVAVVDINRSRAKKLADSLEDRRFCGVQCDASKASKIKPILSKADAAIGAASYSINYSCSQIAIEAGCSFCDLGGNNNVVAKQLRLHEDAAERGVAIIPDCGLAPGLVSVLTAHAISHYDDIHSVKIRCGGLPQKRDGLLDYSLVFSVEGLINEYSESAMVLQDGILRIVPSLEDFERIQFPQPFGELEAFTTSGGISTLPVTFGQRLTNLDYKTIRYPGHGRIFKVLKHLGMFENSGIMAPRELLEVQLNRHLPTDVPDVILLRVVAEGQDTKHIYEIIDYPADGISAMARMTGFPAALVLLALGRKEVRPGVRPQETCIDADKVLAELGSLGVKLNIS